MADTGKKPVVILVGASGTVGLELASLLADRDDLIVKELDARAERASQQAVLAGADLAVLCLPEQAAREFVMAAPPGLRILDASPAHRMEPGWVYGLPELDGDTQAQRIRDASRVANPGCYATGAILLLRPLVAGMPAERHLQVAITAVGGVSTGGRKMLTASVEEPVGYRLYGLDQAHRHIPEIQRYAGLGQTPIFMPAVAGHLHGTLVQIPFTRAHLQLSFEQIVERLQWAYRDTPGVKVLPVEEGQRFLDAAALAHSNDVVIHVHSDASRSRFVLTAQFDNLGKGGAGAAVQNLELMLGLAAH